MRLEESVSQEGRVEGLGEAEVSLQCGESVSNSVSIAASRLTLPSIANSGGVSAVCPLETHHQGKKLLDVVVGLPVDDVCTFIFFQESFMIDVYNDQKVYDVVYKPWQCVDDKRKTRDFTYTITLPPSSFAPKVAYCTEKQVMLPQSEPGELYIVETETVNGGIPYGDHFYCVNHYCLTRDAEGGTRVVVWSNIKYKKNVWGFMKGMIEKNTYNGTELMLQEISDHLAVEADRLHNPVVTRRQRRSTRLSKSLEQISSTRKAKGENDQASPHASGRCNWIGWLIMITLMMAGVFNLFLYRQLFHLENLANNAASVSDAEAIRYFSPSSWTDIIGFLQKQDRIQEKSLDLWRKIITDASVKLKEVQISLEELMQSIPNHRQDLRTHEQEYASNKPSPSTKSKQTLVQEDKKVEERTAEDE